MKGADWVRNGQTWAMSGLTGLCLLGLTALPVTSQEPAGTGLEIVELSGTLEMIVGNQLKMKTTDGQESIVLMGDATSFKYEGTAEPSALSPGLMVRFTGSFDEAGNSQAPLSELEIFRPVRERRMSLELQQKQTPGIYPAQEKEKGKPAPTVALNKSAIVKDIKSGASAQQALKNNSAAKPAPTKPGAANKGAQARNPRDNKGKADAATTPQGSVADFLVVGMLRAIQGDKLQIFAGNRPLIVPFAPDLNVTVTAGDPLFCQMGDEIAINGFKDSSGFIQAETIVVTGAKPLGSVDEKEAARSSRGPKRGKLDEKNATDAKGDKTGVTAAKNRPK
jgi:hypothetical protein